MCRKVWGWSGQTSCIGWPVYRTHTRITSKIATAICSSCSWLTRTSRWRTIISYVKPVMKNTKAHMFKGLIKSHLKKLLESIFFILLLLHLQIQQEDAWTLFIPHHPTQILKKKTRLHLFSISTRSFQRLHLPELVSTIGTIPFTSRPQELHYPIK